MKRILLFLILIFTLTGCSGEAPAPTAKTFINKACAAWNPVEGPRDYLAAFENFAEAASIDSGYIEISKSAFRLKMGFVDKIELNKTPDELFEDVGNIRAICG